MLTLLKLENFRCFQSHSIEIRPLTVIVGQNNAGKSTVVEALRILSAVVSKYRRLPFRKPPKWVGIPTSDVGVAPSLRGLEINFATLFHGYGEPPARITAAFARNRTVTVYLGGEDKIHAVIRDGKGQTIRSRERAIRNPLPIVASLPQLGPLAREESILSEDHVRASMDSYLASQHLRNQINLFRDKFPEFQSNVEATWPNVRVTELDRGRGYPGDPLELSVRDGGFVAEIGVMGHGLQMWMQTLWFLTRARDATAVVLDEPDVYMHPDLQRRLIRLVRSRFKQVIVATHSVEIISEVDPGNVVVIDRRRVTSGPATSLPAVQKIVENVGSVHNLELSRMWNARCLLLVEGKDFGILKAIHGNVYPEKASSLDAIPHMSIGGWGGWGYAVGSRMLLENAAGEKIRTYCLLDSDYHTPEQTKARIAEARERRVSLHIWAAKEIENYLLVPQTIRRVIRRRIGRRNKPPSSSEIAAAIARFAKGHRDTAMDGFAQECLSVNRQLGAGGANKEARACMELRAAQCGLGPAGVVSGKAVLADLSRWSQGEYGVAFAPIAVARAMKSAEVSPELMAIVKAIEAGDEFSGIAERLPARAKQRDEEE